jgi:hypothetical protein
MAPDLETIGPNDTVPTIRSLCSVDCAAGRADLPQSGFCVHSIDRGEDCQQQGQSERSLKTWGTSLFNQ